MSAPAETLGNSGETCVKKKIVPVEHLDLLEEIKPSTGELAALWNRAWEQGSCITGGYEA
jgi:hypothetical protein